MKVISKFTSVLIASVILAVSSASVAVADQRSNRVFNETGISEGTYSGAPRNSTSIQMLHRQYPHGSYFTTTGNACENHDSCKTFDGASQCMGFARYCYYMYNDAHVDTTVADYYSSVHELDADNLPKFLNAVGSQSYIQGYIGKSKHTIFIESYSLSKKKITVYDANTDGKCGVKFETVSFDEFLSSHLNKVLWAYTRDRVDCGYNDFI